MKKVVFVVFSFLLFFLLKENAAASQTYPIQDLGNCRDAKECTYFCNVPENTPLCWSYDTFVLHHNVLGDSTSPDDQARAHGITFPITELGNCTTTSLCTQYCEKEENHDACTAFGKKKGLVHEPESPKVDTSKILSDAKTILGCDSTSSCKTFCSTKENKQKCRLFAEQEGIPVLTPSVSMSPTSLPATIFEVTKNELGCDSTATCKSICNQAENFDRCKAFAEAHNLIPHSSSEAPSITPTSSQTLHNPFQGNESRLPFATPSIKNLTHPVETSLVGRPIPSGSPRPPFGVSSLPQKPLLHANTSLQNTQGLQKSGCTTSQECEKYCKEHVGVCPGFPYKASSSAGILYPISHPTGYPAPSQAYPVQTSQGSYTYPTYPPYNTSSASGPQTATQPSPSIQR